MLDIRRRKERTKMGQPAKIIMKAEAARGCVVDDLTALGACLRFDIGDRAEIPPNFDLTFDNCHPFGPAE